MSDYQKEREANQEDVRAEETFAPSYSVGSATRRQRVKHFLKLKNKRAEWSSSAERVARLREGLPFDAIEVLAAKAGISVKQMLYILQMPQTTYNKRKRENASISSRDSELLLVFSEILDYGMQVFDGKEVQFQHWLQKPNISLGGVSPLSFLDSLTGLEEVRNVLNRIEYGNFA